MIGYAWGPERETFQNGGQPSYVTLNSIVDATGVGDERNFVRVRESGSARARGDYAVLAAGKRYEVYAYYRNDSSFNAEGVRFSSYFSRYVDAEHSGEVMGEIVAENSNPSLIWDGASFLGNGDTVFELNYVEGSAEIHTAGTLNGTKLEGVLDGGALIGYAALDGILPGGAEYAGYVSFEIEAQEASGAVDFEEKVGEKVVVAVAGGMGGGEEGDTTTGGVMEEEITSSSADIPSTGGTMMPVVSAILMGILVAAGWALLIKMEKRAKIGK